MRVRSRSFECSLVVVVGDLLRSPTERDLCQKQSSKGHWFLHCYHVVVQLRLYYGWRLRSVCVSYLLFLLYLLRDYNLAFFLFFCLYECVSFTKSESSIYIIDENDQSDVDKERRPICGFQGVARTSLVNQLTTTLSL